MNAYPSKDARHSRHGAVRFSPPGADGASSVWGNSRTDEWWAFTQNSKGVTFPHGGATECSSNGCVAIQFANAKLDNSPVTSMMMFVDPLRPDKVSFHLPFGRSKLESASSLKIEMYTGNPMMGDRNSDLYEFSLMGFTKASEWCRSGRHPASSLKSGGESPASGG